MQCVGTDWTDVAALCLFAITDLLGGLYIGSLGPGSLRFASSFHIISSSLKCSNYEPDSQLGPRNHCAALPWALQHMWATMCNMLQQHLRNTFLAESCGCLL